MEDSWKEAREKFDNEIFPKILVLGSEIGRKVTLGDAQAKEIVRLYSMLHRSFDPLTMILLEKEVEKYQSL